MSAAVEALPSMKGENEPQLRFRLGERVFGLPLFSIREVALLGPLSRIPGKTPASLLGVMNLRGRVILVADLGLLLGEGRAHRGGASERLLVLDEGRHDFGIVVSDALEIAHLSADEEAPAPTDAATMLSSADLLRRVTELVDACGAERISQMG
ncbi:MAG: chemotaxis protein CheW [Deltaproteobacteria bacterium]